MEDEGNIKGVFIIKLPPPNDPSQKKTITGALTFSQNPHPEPNPDPNLSFNLSSDPPDDEDYRLPLHTNHGTSRPLRPTRRGFHFFKRKGLAALLFVAAVAYFLWQYGPSTLKEVEELDPDNIESSQRAIVYSVYSKILFSPNADSSSVPSIPSYSSNITASSPSAISKRTERDVVRSSTRVGSPAEAAPSGDSKETSTTIFPLRGNIYPDGTIKDVLHIFKPIVFEFRSSGGWFRRNSRMQLTPEGYLIINSKGNVCLGLLDAKVMGNDGPSIIGDISMRGNLVVYDNENNRLGWMKQDCRMIPKDAVLSPSV